MNQERKRNRSANWEEAEKQLFLLILKEYAPILENKSLDTNTNKLKAKAWEAAHKKFNELNRRPRQLCQLKLQWKSLKMHAKKSNNVFDKTILNGTARSDSPDEDNVQVIELNPQELLDHSAYDSDGSDLKPKQDCVNDAYSTLIEEIKQQNHTGYIDMLNHSRKLKEIEDDRRMEMAEEEHAIKMKIHEEKLKCVILEREILELRKAREKRQLEL